jgi:uncharacterized protein YaaN involved in tellurite resistance
MTESTAFVLPPELANVQAPAIAVAPVTPISTGLQQVALRMDNPQSLQLSRTLAPADLERAKSDAVKSYPELKANSIAFLNFGDQAVAPLNQQVDRMLHEIGPVRVKILEAPIGDLRNDMRSIQRGYDVSDPKIRKDLDATVDKAKGWFRKGHSVWDRFQDSQTSVEHKIDAITAILIQKQNELQKNIVICDQLTTGTEKELENLRYVITVMEMIQQLAKEEAAAIKLNPSDPNDPAINVQKRLADFAVQMGAKIDDMNTRFWLGFTSVPQIATERALNVNLVFRLHSVANIIMPTQKLMLARARMMLAAAEGAGFVNAVGETENEMLQAYGELMKNSLPGLAQAASRPILTAATITKMADDYVAAADGIIAAFSASEELKAQNVAAMKTSAALISQTSAKVTAAQINSVLKQSLSQPENALLALPAPQTDVNQLLSLPNPHA